MNETDEDDFEEWLLMSEKEQDAALDRVMKKYSESIKKLNPSQLYKYRRQRRLELCVQQRKLTKEFSEVFWPMLKSTQRRLLEARIEFYTGKVSGHC